MISAFSRERDNFGTCAASTRSRRADPSPLSIVICSLSAVSEDEPCMSETEYSEPTQELTQEQAAIFARVRRMMLIASITTAVAIAAVLVAIGYRLFSSEGSSAVKDVTATLPKGARIYATAVAGDKLVLMLDVNGATEIRTFDAQTLKPSGRLTFATAP